MRCGACSVGCCMLLHGVWWCLAVFSPGVSEFKPSRGVVSTAWDCEGAMAERGAGPFLCVLLDLRREASVR